MRWLPWLSGLLKDITSGGLKEAYGEFASLKTLFGQTYDGIKERGLSEAVAARDGISQAYSEVKSLGAQIVSETYLASKAVGSEARSGLKDGFSDLVLADRTRDAFRGLTRMLDSFLLTTVSLGDVGYDSVEAVISGVKIGVAKTSVWGMTVVNSFESLVGLSSQTAQNIYVVSPSADHTM